MGIPANLTKEERLDRIVDDIVTYEHKRLDSDTDKSRSILGACRVALRGWKIDMRALFGRRKDEWNPDDDEKRWRRFEFTLLELRDEVKRGESIIDSRRPPQIDRKVTSKSLASDVDSHGLYPSWVDDGHQAPVEQTFERQRKLKSILRRCAIDFLKHPDGLPIWWSNWAESIEVLALYEWQIGEWGKLVKLVEDIENRLTKSSDRYSINIDNLIIHDWSATSLKNEVKEWKARTQLEQNSGHPLPSRSSARPPAPAFRPGRRHGVPP